jgi:hypothetical protein
MPRVFGFAMPWPKSGLVVVAAGVPLVYAVGQVVQAVSSIVQPVYYGLWGGRPSAVILEGRSTGLSGPRLDRIIGSLSAYFDARADTPEEHDALFADAMALCNAGRSAAFTALTPATPFTVRSSRRAGRRVSLCSAPSRSRPRTSARLRTRFDRRWPTCSSSRFCSQQ